MKSAIIGMAVGTLMGALVVNSFSPANDMVGKVKEKVKGKIEDLSSQSGQTHLIDVNVQDTHNIMSNFGFFESFESASLYYNTSLKAFA